MCNFDFGTATAPKSTTVSASKTVTLQLPTCFSYSVPASQEAVPTS